MIFANERSVRNWQKADKHVRNYRHRCLIPLCDRAAIRSHAIQRAAIENAFAIGGHVYTTNMSFLSALNKDASKEREIKKVSSRKAGTFSGFCAEQDHQLFKTVEDPKESKRENMQIALYVRSVALEYSRKRDVAIFYERLLGLEENFENYAAVKELANKYRYTADWIFHRLLRPVLTRSLLDRLKKIDFLVIPFPGNLLVSCAGVFNVVKTHPKSIVAYNLISYPDMSFLSLTTRKSRSGFIDQFIQEYNDMKELERMVNDIAFLKGEEPLISPKLWNSFSSLKRKNLSRSLVHPEHRTMTKSLDFISLPKDETGIMASAEFYNRIGMDEKLASKIIGSINK